MSINVFGKAKRNQRVRRVLSEGRQERDREKSEMRQRL